MKHPAVTDRRAELTLLLAATGLSIADAAQYLGNQDRTLRRWCNDPSQDIPTDVLSRLRELDRWIEALAADIPTDVLILPDGNALTRLNTQGMPIASYRMACVRAWHRAGRRPPLIFEPEV